MSGEPANFSGKDMSARGGNLGPISILAELYPRRFTWRDVMILPLLPIRH
jgi:hypothetical protein